MEVISNYKETITPSQYLVQSISEHSNNDISGNYFCPQNDSHTENNINLNQQNKTLTSNELRDNLRLKTALEKSQLCKNFQESLASQNKLNESTHHEVCEQKIIELNQKVQELQPYVTRFEELNQNFQNEKISHERNYRELEQKFDTAFQELLKHKENFETRCKELEQPKNSKDEASNHQSALEVSTNLKMDDDDKSHNVQLNGDSEEVSHELSESKQLSISITGSSTRNGNGENKTSTASLTSVDWEYAKRKVALNFLNAGAFETLPDEELERLMGDIKKIQNAQRTDFAFDKSDFKTYDTPYPPEISSAELEDKLRVFKEEMQQQLDLQEQEYEKKMKLIEESNLEADELKAEKKQMEERLKMVQKETQIMLEAQAQEYQRKMKRLTHAPHKLPSDVTPYTEEELRLIHMVFKKWKRQRFVQMAETILSNAVILKEANVISKVLEKKILYQFTIVEDEPYTKPISYWESTSAFNEFCNNEDTSLHASKKPCVGVKVIDTKNDVIYVWSLDKLKARLLEMRNLYNFFDRPQYSKHLNWKDPFYESPCPRFTFIGSASVGLTCLLKKTEHEHNIPVIRRYSGDVLGYCKVRIKFVAQVIHKPEDISSILSIGSKVVFEVKILKLSGIKESQYSQVHIQYKLPFFGNVHPLIPGEHIYTTDPATDFGNKPIIYNYDQALNMDVSPEMMEVLTSGMLTFEVFGIAKRCVLEDMERWDDRNERDIKGNGLSERMRLSEDELVAEEKHDVVAWVQVCEPTPTGEYVPVQILSQNSLDPGAFFLRQGLQRRIMLTLTHNSGQQFSWSKITKMEIGQVRLLDGKGRLTESPVQRDIQMNMLPSQNVQYNGDGTSMIVAQASWDSTLHESIFLNKATQSNSRVLLGLKWYVEAEKCVEPISFCMDIAVQIQGREARPPSKLIQLLNQSKVSWKSSGLFSITLKPPMIRKVSELWRVNTTNKYVRGEELLDDWKPRGITLIKDYKKISERIRRLEAVEYTKQILAIHETRKELPDDKLENCSNSVDLANRTVTLWKKKWGTAKEIVINQEPPLLEPYQDIDSWRNTKPAKLVTQVRLVVKTDIITKKGHLFTPENVGGNWVKRWYVLRRPYLYIYESQKETEEQGIINLASARVDHNECTEEMLQRQNVFTIYTSNNSYILQASTKQEMQDWISKISITTQSQQ